MHSVNNKTLQELERDASFLTDVHEIWKGQGTPKATNRGSDKSLGALQFWSENRRPVQLSPGDHGSETPGQERRRKSQMADKSRQVQVRGATRLRLWKALYNGRSNFDNTVDEDSAAAVEQLLSASDWTNLCTSPDHAHTFNADAHAPIVSGESFLIYNEPDCVREAQEECDAWNKECKLEALLMAAPHINVTDRKRRAEIRSQVTASSSPTPPPSPPRLSDSPTPQVVNVTNLADEHDARRGMDKGNRVATAHQLLSPVMEDSYESDEDASVVVSTLDAVMSEYREITRTVSADSDAEYIPESNKHSLGEAIPRGSTSIHPSSAVTPPPRHQTHQASNGANKGRRPMNLDEVIRKHPSDKVRTDRDFTVHSNPKIQDPVPGASRRSTAPPRLTPPRRDDETHKKEKKTPSNASSSSSHRRLPNLDGAMLESLSSVDSNAGSNSNKGHQKGGGQTIKTTGIAAAETHVGGHPPHQTPNNKKDRRPDLRQQGAGPPTRQPSKALVQKYGWQGWPKNWLQVGIPRQTGKMIDYYYYPPHKGKEDWDNESGIRLRSFPEVLEFLSSQQD